MKRFSQMVVFSWVLAAAAIPAAAQVFDRTGNGTLNGDYYFRHGVWYTDTMGNVYAATTYYGTITFDGNGKYAISGYAIDSQQGSGQFQPVTGTYSISASGYGYLDLGMDKLYGLVSNGVFVGSRTDAGYNDVFVAVQASGATNASFKGEYRLGYLNYPTGSFSDNYGALATLNPDGAGNVGAVPLKFYVASTGATTTTQNITGVKYSFSNGTGTLTFPSTPQTNALQGAMLLLISPDGNFIVGGSAFDLFIGVRRQAANPPLFSGLYYLAGINQVLQDPSVGGATDTYFGSLVATNGTIIGHQRYYSASNGAAQNYTYSDMAPDVPVADYVDDPTSTEYFFSPDAKFRMGFGEGPFLGLSIAVKAPAFSGPGVYLNPTGVVNGASSAPFTAGIARGELLLLYGSNLANSDLTVADALPLPTTLDGVQVKINNRPAPIYYVKRDVQNGDTIAAVVPYGTVEQIAQVQVFKNNVGSNAVTVFVYDSAPGVFTVPPGGAGYGAVLHNTDYTLVTPDNPAHVGDYLAVYVTGLGDVFPTIQDGAPGPSGNYSQADNITAFIDALPADVVFAGLAPTLPALYQVNLQVPDGVRAGDVYLDIAGATSYTSQALLPTAGAAASDARAAGTVRYRRR